LNIDNSTMPLPKPHTYLLIILLFFMVKNQLRAEHIYGGNLYMVQTDKDAGKFKIALTMFVDFIIMPASENTYLQATPVTIRIFRKRDNAQVQEISMPFDALQDLVYDNATCARVRNLRTRQYRYAKEVSLNLDNFTDAGGYYMAWAKCCRNSTVDNIASPGVAGMTLYLEFPALKQNGQAVQYSSPIFNQPNGDYICNNKPFRYDLSAVDKDTLNELRYSIVTPFGSHNAITNASDKALPAPYPLTRWLSGFSANVSIKGSKPLSIDPKTGLVSVTAGEVGLFVFSVQCEQYRNGQKIGLARYDFQLPVVDCSTTTPPQGRITQGGNPITEASICLGETVNLEVSNTGGTFNFQWQKDGDNIVGATNATYQATQLGNYTVVKSFKNVCANDTISQVVKVKQANLVKLLPSPKELCEGDSILLEATPLRTSVVFNWNKGGVALGNKAKFYAKSTGKYYVLGSIISPNCESKDSVEITKRASPKLTIDTINITVPLGESQTLNVRSDNVATTFKWSPPKWIDNVSINNPKVTPEDNIIYRVLASTPNLCPVKDSVMVFVTKSILIPNMFSPNADGMNDTWEISGIQNFRDCEVSIFNRWGEIIYYSKGYSNPWDGKFKGTLVSTGQYAYEIRGASQREGFVYVGVLGVGY
jgi:gliding motility-associated-like protein